MEYTISSYITIEHNGFGDADFSIIGPILSSIEEEMMALINKQPYSFKNIYIRKGSNNPRIYNQNGLHVIELTTTHNYWCQWIYQFAHEYCHHLIDGNLSGDLCGLIWFEEVLCETCSIYCLISIERRWEFMFPGYASYRECIRSYIYDLLINDIKIEYPILESNAYIRTPLGFDYNRDLYLSLACRIWLPLLLEKPSLWKVLNYIGESRAWGSLSDLLVHLEQTADSSYIKQMRICRWLHSLYIR